MATAKKKQEERADLMDDNSDNDDDDDSENFGTPRLQSDSSRPLSPSLEHNLM
jgi:hypothetical protein